MNETNCLNSYVSRVKYFIINECHDFQQEYEKVQNHEVIAIVHVTGSINDSLARKTIQALHHIKHRDDVKCVILRVDSPGGSAVSSEAILEECKNLNKPYICSFGNVAASGGYYIASYASRIFALDTTVTGSIGVFGVKVDLSTLANSYSINVKYLTSGDHGATYSIFSPLSEEMIASISRQLGRTYLYFKYIVSSGRRMSLEEVESLAQGRVWTGKEAQHIGLIDNIGGIHRSISYAQKNFSSSGRATIEFWPKAPTIFESGLLLMDSATALGENRTQDVLWIMTQPSAILHADRVWQIDPIMMTIDENAILHYMFDRPDA